MISKYSLCFVIRSWIGDLTFDSINHNERGTLMSKYVKSSNFLPIIIFYNWPNDCNIIGTYVTKISNFIN